MGRWRLTDREFVTPETYFATYVDKSLRGERSASVIQHLHSFGAALLHSDSAADTIIEEWLAEHER